MTLGEKVRARRLELKLSQDELAEIVGISQPSLSDIENGQTEWPRGNNIVPLADALQVTTDYLLRGEAADAESN